MNMLYFNSVWGKKMAHDSRTILAIKREKEIIEKNINNTERDCGHQLCQNTNTQLVTKSEKATYYSYEEKNNQIRDNMKTIRELVEKLHEINKAASETHDTETELIGQWDGWYKTLGQMMYRHYTPLFESVFGEYYTKAQAQQKKRDEAENTAGNVKKNMEKQGFFSRLFLQVKYVSTHNTIASYDNRFNAFLEKGGKSAYNSAELSSLINHDEVDATVRRAYYSCVKLEKDIADEHKNGIDLLENEKTIKAQLDEFGVSGFGEKRLQQLRREIDSNVKEQNKYASEKAHIFANMYVEENGTVKKDFPEEFCSALSMIADLRMEQVSVNRRIQIQELVEQITAANRQLIINTRKIKGNTKKIETLTVQNQELSVKNDTLQVQKKDWENLKVTLDLAEATNVKHLREKS
jgi:hypothetical protein